MSADRELVERQAWELAEELGWLEGSKEEADAFMAGARVGLAREKETIEVAKDRLAGLEREADEAEARIKRTETAERAHYQTALEHGRNLEAALAREKTEREWRERLQMSELKEHEEHMAALAREKGLREALEWAKGNIAFDALDTRGYHEFKEKCAAHPPLEQSDDDGDEEVFMHEGRMVGSAEASEILADMYDEKHEQSEPMSASDELRAFLATARPESERQAGPE